MHTWLKYSAMGSSRCHASRCLDPQYTMDLPTKMMMIIKIIKRKDDNNMMDSFNDVERTRDGGEGPCCSVESSITWKCMH